MEEIKNGIIHRLDALFPDVPIYDETVKQGFEEPCFFVVQLNGAQSRGMDRRRIRTALFDVRYFPPDSLVKKTACEQMARQLYETLETAECDGIRYRGRNLHHETVDDVLHFFVSFDVHLMLQKPAAPVMQKLNQEVRISDGN